ncbi:aminotransferase class IV [Candidatus Carsonella ruddii]|uniref:Branched-chain-amino-acid aminotransferase n=1 Tax=Candidatus Carsonella ruddii (Diaphorina cf. continua) TaxID=2661587 RepID=A0A7R7ABL6_CARRU|nr:aminotransferase class IV [Candidatus Carsonella ruddii (Diaphorina cf. continua)]BCG49411.1 branched-chain-amino-acid aminotransferase [Candidatus Carsonella ruddii (Diaphorina cf. continua)]
MKNFEYKKVKFRYVKIWNSKWNIGFFIKKNKILINEGSTSINYSQQCFEGIKSFNKNKKVFNLRTNLNSYRFQKSSRFADMPIINIYEFIIIILIISKLNKKYIPNYKIGFLYLRPLLIGIGKNIGVKTSKKFFFTIFCIPSFYTKESIFLISVFSERTQHQIGHYKIGNNYIKNIINNFYYKKNGFNDYVYINKNIFEEIGTSNIIFYKKKNIFSPISKNILPGINKFSFISLFKIKKELLKIEFSFKNINNIKTIISCGTAASIRIVKTILYKNKIIKYKNNHFQLLLSIFFKKIYKKMYNVNKWIF